MDFRFTPAEEAFRDEVRTWLADHLTGEFAKAGPVGGQSDDEAWELRVAWEKELSAGGWLGLGWPREYGGRGATVNEEIIFANEYAQAKAPTRAGIGGLDLLGPTLITFGTEEQKQRFLPRILKVEEFWCQGFSEPNAGSDLANIQTGAELRGNEWIINGQKVWTTFADRCQWMYCLCRTDPAEPKHKGLSMLLVPTHQPGVEIRPLQTIAGTAEFCEVFLSDARTSADLVLGPVNDGWRVTMGTLGFERGTSALPHQMAFEREMDNLIALASTKGALDNPLVRQRIASAWIDVQVMRFNTYRVLTRLMRKGTLGPESSIGKLYYSTLHKRMGELGIELMGPSSEIIGDDYELDAMQKTFLNSRAETIYGGSAEIQHNILGERVLELPKEPVAGR